MCLEVKKNFIKKWAKKTMPDYKVAMAEMGYITFKKENPNFSIGTDIRVQFSGTLLSFAGFTGVFKSFENLFEQVLYKTIECNILKEYYDNCFSIGRYKFPYSEYIFPESVKDEEELNLYLSEFCKCVRFYETEIFPKLTDINFLAEYVGSVPFENALEIVVGGTYPVTFFKKLAILKWGNHYRYEEYKKGLARFIEEDLLDPKYQQEAPLYKQGFEKLIYHLENEPNPFL